MTKINGTQILYEIEVTAFDYYGGLAGKPSIPSLLEAGKTVRFDLTVITCDGMGYGGMFSENLMTGKYSNADQWAVYKLVE